MATYTDNYNLIKPTYAETADIVPLNNNFEKIDEVMHSSQVSLAPAYDQTKEYAAGDKVMYELLMYKCTAPTTGVWDPSKWERTTASESGGGGSAELDILGEASGAVASFADGASAGLAKCIAEIVPKQDLHGYDKPWAGGAGKNKLNLSLSRLKIINIGGTWSGNTYSFRGVTFEITASDGVTVDSIKANGTTSGGQAYIIIADAQMLTMESDEEFILTNDTNGYAESVYNGSSSSASTTGTLTFTFSGFTSGWNMTIGVPNGATATDVIFRPMVRKSNVSDATYEPYSNICPISGSTSVTVTVSDGETSTTKTAPLGQTVYGGQLNVLTGLLTITNGYIASYNGETLPSTWISDRDEYAPNTSPTTGAQVVYPLATPHTVQLTPQEVNSLLGQNNISADTGDIDIVYVKASAPIQPNPTGTPTATLKKLGIEGTVFEVEGGGGGSSLINYSTTEQKTGQKWIDGKDIYCKCYQTTISSADNTYIDNTLNNSTIQILPMSSIAIDTKGIYNSTYVFNIYNGCILRIFSNNTGIGVNCENYNTNFGTSTVYTVLYYTKMTD